MDRLSVIPFPFKIVNFSNWTQNFQGRKQYNKKNLLFDLKHDYAQQHPINDAKLETELIIKLRTCMELHDSPQEQFERLGL